MIRDEKKGRLCKAPPKKTITLSNNPLQVGTPLASCQQQCDKNSTIKSQVLNVQGKLVVKKFPKGDRWYWLPRHVSLTAFGRFRPRVFAHRHGFGSGLFVSPDFSYDFFTSHKHLLLGTGLKPCAREALLPRLSSRQWGFGRLVASTARQNIRIFWLRQKFPEMGMLRGYRRAVAPLYPLFVAYSLVSEVMPKGLRAINPLYLYRALAGAFRSACARAVRSSECGWRLGRAQPKQPVLTCRRDTCAFLASSHSLAALTKGDLGNSEFPRGSKGCSGGILLLPMWASIARHFSFGKFGGAYA